MDARAAGLRGHDDPPRRRRALHAGIPDGMSVQPLWSGYREPGAEEPAPAVSPVRDVPARRTRPARGRPVVVDVLAALAGLGLGATPALGLFARALGALRAGGRRAPRARPPDGPGRRVRDGGRCRARRARRTARAGDRPGPARALAPAPGPVAAV